MKPFVCTAAVAAALFAPAVHAQYGAAASIGTDGLALHLSTALQSRINARVGVKFLNVSHDTRTNTVNYDLKLRLRGLEALVDYFPMDNSQFRVSAGLVCNGNEFRATGRPTSASTYVINGNAYLASEVGTLNGDVDFRNVAPYVGIGFGNAVTQKRITVQVDVGVMFQGSPRTTLTSTGCPASAVRCSQLQADLAAENQQLREKVKDFKAYPVVRIGAGYSF